MTKWHIIIDTALYTTYHAHTKTFLLNTGIIYSSFFINTSGQSREHLSVLHTNTSIMKIFCVVAILLVGALYTEGKVGLKVLFMLYINLMVKLWLQRVQLIVFEPILFHMGQGLRMDGTPPPILEILHIYGPTNEF